MTVHISYEDVLKRIDKSKKDKSGAVATSKSEDSSSALRFAKAIRYFCLALERGQWPNGTKIDQREIAATLRRKFIALSPSEVAAVPLTARRILRSTLEEVQLNKEARSHLTHIFEVIRTESINQSSAQNLFAPGYLDLA